MNDAAGDEHQDVYDLLWQLRKEKLFITSERNAIEALTQNIKYKTDDLFSKIWVSTKLRLLLLEHRELTVKTYRQIENITQAVFGLARDVLGYKTTVKVEVLLQSLRSQPEQLARWLFAGENCEKNQRHLEVLHSVVSGLYASCVYPDDMRYMLKLLIELAKLQLLKSDNPRQMLKDTSCSFRNMYFIFSEVLMPAKYFLNAGLEKPILLVLSYRELHLDIDPAKTAMRYQMYHRADFNSLEDHRAEVVEKLAEFTNAVITSLCENMYCFPEAIAWIISQISKLITESFGSKEANAIVTEMLFTLYICPAILHPEQYGICVPHFTEIARHNLMQVAQLLQLMALNNFELSPDVTSGDIYNLLHKDNVSNFIETVLFNVEHDSEPPVDLIPLGVDRDAAVFTEYELSILITFLKKVSGSSIDGLVRQKTQRLPMYRKQHSNDSNSIVEQMACLTLPASVENTLKSTAAYANGFATPESDDYEPNFFAPGQNALVSSSAESPDSDVIFAVSDEPGLDSSYHLQEKDDCDELDISYPFRHFPLMVMRFSITEKENVDPYGLLSEEKVLNSHLSAAKKDVMFASVSPEIIDIASVNVSVVDGNDDGEDGNKPYGTSTYHHDEGSIGNTSDNLEAISEAASNHSVASSLDLEENEEDQNDNLSDMISANVSGRGTPNISGRDTPSSQVNENEEQRSLPDQDARPRGNGGGSDNAAMMQTHRQPQSQLSRQIRSEIDDKFCKFEIKKLLEGDETISIISETWSTDVLASDNETIEGGDSRLERLQGLQLVDQAISEVPTGNILDISETQSESAWSTDVNQSDTERLTEVDNDDTVSVAQSDDTRSETDENLGGVAPVTPPVVSGAMLVPNRRLSATAATTANANQWNNFYASTHHQHQHHLHQHQEYQQRKENLKAAAAIAATNTTSTNTNSNTTTTTTDSNANNLVSAFKPVLSGGTNNRRVTTNTSSVTSSATITNSSSSNNLQQQQQHRRQSKDSGPGAAVTTTTVAATDLLMKQNSYEERPSDILLSNCSLNSSSSGGSSGSNSFENSNGGGSNSKNGGGEGDNGGGGGGDGGNVDGGTEGKWQGSKQWMTGSGSSLNVTSGTLSESTSELSVLSNPAMANKKQGHMGGSSRNLKPSASTGAIPKSISFDTSADKGDKSNGNGNGSSSSRYMDDEMRSKSRGGSGGGGSFFGKLKMGFRNRRSVKSTTSFRSHHPLDMESDDYDAVTTANMRSPNGSPIKTGNGSSSNCDASEDILAKYRTKPFIETNPAPPAATTSADDRRKNGNSRPNSGDPTDSSNSFDDIKKKLRLVLGNNISSQIPRIVKETRTPMKCKLETVLRLELGRARKMNEWSSIARVADAIRCVNLLSESSCTALIKSMREDYVQRSVYTQYLLCSRQNLIHCDYFINGLIEQLGNEKKQCERYVTVMCVRRFLSDHESKIAKFNKEFQELRLPDEKCDLLKHFIEQLLVLFSKKSRMWNEILVSRCQPIKVTLERFLMSSIYPNAFHPNGDGDRHRDHVLDQHIEKLSNIITPYHKDLMIHKTFLREFPWTPAQDALRPLGVYRTPRDKVTCVVNCAKCIVDLLAFSQTAGCTTADDFTPVLVYVIIKANPGELLSTIQFVNNFFVNHLRGETQYWWTQFCSAVEFIKTMDYSD